MLAQRGAAAAAAAATSAAAARGLSTGTAPRLSLAAVEKLFRDMECRKSLPWENAVTAEEAARVLKNIRGARTLKGYSYGAKRRR